MKLLVGLLAAGLSFSSAAGSLKSPQAKVIKFHTATGVILVQEDDNPRHGSPHVDDPAECRKFCYPPGGNADRPSGVNPEAEGYECQGDLCAKASKGEHGPPGEGEDPEDMCKPHYSCNVHCSEVCCSCLRECI